ncbi:uncharacterized protein V6R79_024418 [Siganus canaliculatus]
MRPANKWPTCQEEEKQAERQELSTHQRRLMTNRDTQRLQVGPVPPQQSATDSTPRTQLHGLNATDSAPRTQRHRLSATDSAPRTQRHGLNATDSAPWTQRHAEERDDDQEERSPPNSEVNPGF